MHGKRGVLRMSALRPAAAERNRKALLKGFAAQRHGKRAANILTGLGGTSIYGKDKNFSCR
jgi:hypothetical protein